MTTISGFSSTALANVYLEYFKSVGKPIVFENYDCPLVMEQWDHW